MLPWAQPLLWKSVVGPTCTTVFSQSLPSVDTGWGNYNLRMLLNSSLMSANNGTSVRLTIQASTGGSAASVAIDSIYIGHAATSGNAYDFNGTQVPLTFAGSTSITIPPNGSAVSDAVAYNFD